MNGPLVGLIDVKGIDVALYGHEAIWNNYAQKGPKNTQKKLPMLELITASQPYRLSHINQSY